MKQRGMTLIELLAGLVLIAIMATIALPALGALVDSHRRQDAAQQLASSLRLARAEAILRGQPVIVQAVKGDWENGWSVFVDSNRNQVQDDDETVLVERSGYRNTRVVGNRRVANGIGFDGTGRPLNNANGTLAVCLHDSTTSHLQVVIAVTGRVDLRSKDFSSEPCA